MRGKKFRVMRDPVAMDMVQALGGSPTPIPWGGLYTALKQGVVDGAENTGLVDSGTCNRARTQFEGFADYGAFYG